MTIGYGGIQELHLPLKWAKLALSARGHSGMFHAWTPIGGVCWIAKAAPGPTKVSRDSQPVKSCAFCVKEVANLG